MKKLTKKNAAVLIECQLIRPGYFRYFWNNKSSDIFNQLGDYETSTRAYNAAREAFNNVRANATKAERIEAICKAVNA